MESHQGWPGLPLTKGRKAKGCWEGLIKTSVWDLKVYHTSRDNHQLTMECRLWGQELRGLEGPGECTEKVVGGTYNCLKSSEGKQTHSTAARRLWCLRKSVSSPEPKPHDACPRSTEPQGLLATKLRGGQVPLTEPV